MAGSVVLRALFLAAGALAGASAAKQEDLLIRGGTVVTAEREFAADVVVQGGKITQVAEPGTAAAPRGARTIDATGQYVMPGGIDPHTHLDMPFMGQVAADDYYSGHAAALAGGTTMHIDFALPLGGMKEGLKIWREKAKLAAMDYGFHMAVFEMSEQTKADMADMVAEGINSFKFFLAYKNALMVTDEQLVKGMQRCKELGALVQVHAENGDAVAEGQQRMIDLGITGPEGHAYSRPAVLEGEATARAIRLAKFVNVPLYVVHVMSKDALDEVAKARQDGQRVIGEPVVSGLTMDESMMWHPDFKVAAQYVMSPPIRKLAVDGVALQKALANNVLQLVATDHAVFNSTQKAKGRHDFRVLPNGVNGIEERMIVVWDTMVASGMMTPSEYVRATSTACARIFNVYPQKGSLTVGADADIILLDPAKKTTISAATHHSRMDTNIYEGREVSGAITTTVSRGRVVWADGKLDVEAGSGKFVPMKPFGELFNGLDKQDAANAPKAVPREGDAAAAGKDEL